MNAPLKVLAICADRSGPYYQDFHIPFNYFNKFQLLQCSTTGSVFKLEDLKDIDILVFQRQVAAESLMLVRAAKKMGKVCIFVVDDNVWDLPKSSPAYSQYQGLFIDRYNTSLSECHAFWTSTEFLRVLGLKYNKYGTVLRNLVEPVLMEFLPEGKDNPDQVRIGWFGTQHHHDDIVYIEPALKKLYKMYGKKIKYVFMGYKPPHIGEWTNRWDYEYYDFVQTDAFYPALANLDFDIGIAPLVDNNFNRGKTARKAQEYGLFKIPAVLANVAPYHDWEHEVNCLKPKSNKVDGWAYQIERLINDPVLRKELAIRANDYVLKNHSIQTYLVERAQFFYDVFNRVHGVNLEVPIGGGQE